MGDMRSAHRILVGRPERKKSLGRPRRRWKDDIKIVHREVLWEVVDWIHLALVNMVGNFFFDQFSDY
jgi:hypothetical protein